MKEDLFKNLRPDTRRWASAIRRQFVLEPHHERLLLAAGQAWDRSQEAKACVDRDGAIVCDRFGAAKEHPGNAAEARAMLTFLKCLQHLGLDLERPSEPRAPCRPGGYR